MHSSVCLYCEMLFAYRLMPRRRKRQTKRASSCPVALNRKTSRPSRRKQWTNESMLAALQAVKDGEGVNRAAILHGILPSMLKDRLSSRVVHGVNPGPNRYLDDNEEKLLAEHLVEAAKLVYPFNRNTIQIPHSTSSESSKPSVQTSSVPSTPKERIPSSGVHPQLNSSTCHESILDRFTPAQVERFMVRHEEGYDLYDPEYIYWLEVYHPEALPHDHYTLTAAQNLTSLTEKFSSVDHFGQ